MKTIWVHLNASVTLGIKSHSIPIGKFLFARDLKSIHHCNVLLLTILYKKLDLKLSVDIDECELKEHQCDLNAACTNTEGSYICKCYEPLFHGSGFDCHYHDPCYIQPCDKFSMCFVDDEDPEGFSCPCNEVDGGINRLGDGRLSGPGCSCPKGYETGIEDLCVDIDECNDFKHDCDWKADCVNIEASFDCVCKDGYQGDGYHCTDVDECLGPE